MNEFKLERTQTAGVVYTNNGYKTTIPAGQSVDDVAVLECVVCVISFQKPFTCKKIPGSSTENCAAVYCGRCYLDVSRKYKKCIICHEPITGGAAAVPQASNVVLLKHIWKKILVQCGEKSCQRVDIPLVNYEDHMKVAHKVFKPPIIDDKFNDHMRVMNEVVDENQQEELLPSTSRVHAGVQNLQAAPSQTTHNSLVNIVEQLDHNGTCLLLMDFCGRNISDVYVLKDISVVSEMLELSISEGKTLNDLQIVLKSASEKECFKSYEVFYNTFFYQNAGQCSDRSSDSLNSYMNEELHEIIGDVSDRRGRVKFLKFVSMCSIDDLKYINKQLNLRVSFENCGVEGIEFIGAEIMFKIICNCMSLNDILRRIEHTSPSQIIVEWLRKKINIERLPVTEDIQSRFKEIIKFDDKARGMAVIINNTLSPGQTFRLALLLMYRTLGSIVSGSKTFTDLFQSLYYREATVEELVVALVDADLFGVVREQITACYGNPV